ncbi:glycosyltransferase [Synechococcus sp. Cruz-9H2]|uniref:glycosyltransferase n=1 Tax=unclassified Synechococcus TaxID=2626047 RepID=UPI0020CEBD5E|nr:MULTISPECIES: glycosyltransferase family A protein [unclassified Synechococcus]MCP9818387.1 glycosyltransferase [Synechococcus sp. Cruz-9H2]MCP9842114.1 glycosyltransferase [Synechococcus sp. Edmonson 11F2]MCP9854783.1 glycosyltransferase [Synechococcus sp. Cruz-9C9]MCP9861522.1 glycosyltransferase [Synechococcus sp. Cruz-7E5]MCP9869295.1 glycosyltransferase [Synechococcus sp. Cruz-7B9]
MNLVAISLLVRWQLGWALCLRLLRLPMGKVDGHPSVSVLIPARDEEGTLPNLLPALQAQTFSPLEVIVIDDHSSDQTAAIAAAAGATVIQPPPLAEGWCGKTWALHHGVQACKGEILVFLDADTEPSPEFLERLVADQQNLGGLVSVQPFHRTEKAYEQLSVLFSLVGLMAVPMGPGCGVAFGPAMATSRKDYDRVGGHEAVAGKVVEDWFMGHLYEEAGLPVSAYIGDGLIEYRMYPGGFRDMVTGFAKNFATAAGEVHGIWMLAVLLWISGLFWAAWCLPASLLGWPLMGQPSVLPNLLLYLAFAVQLITLTRRVGNFAWICLVFPIPVLFFLAVFFLAIINLKQGTIEWKGRQVSTR